MAEAVEQPAYLILGGCGMVGRNLVQYLIANNLARKIRVADKAMPMTSYFHPRVLEVFNDPRVEYMQVDLTKPPHRDRAFDGEQFDYVINLAAETKYSQDDKVYEARCTLLSIECARKAAERGVRRFVEVSTALVYKSQSKRPSVESAELSPWTKQSQAKLAAEEGLRQIEGLNVVVLRPAFIYGPGDVNGIMPRVTCAASYVVLNEPMRLLWDANMHINTVHVEDVVRAIVHVATNDAVPAWSVFNLVDKNDTTQGKLNALLENIFHISTGFLGTMLSNLAKIRLQDVVDTANEKHLQPWTEMLRQHAIHASPLTPYISSELLAHNQLFVSGEAIEATGFGYAHPVMTEDALRESIYLAIEQRIFPPIVDGAPEPLPEPREDA